jgi:hypothetical protein
VRVLLDESIDWRLSRHISGHNVKTTRQRRWAGLENGELLARASIDFDVFVTVDRNLSFQQNIGSVPIGVIVLRARTNRLSDLKRFIPTLMAAIEFAKPGVVG